MASLTDIATFAKQVDVNGIKIDVFGVSAEGFASLMGRFPEINKLMSGIKLDGSELMKMGPAALAAFLAAGTGSTGNEEAEKVAARLPVGAQLDIIQEILKQTFPRGVDPFVKQLEALGVLVQVQNPSPQTSPASAKPSSPKATEK